MGCCWSCLFDHNCRIAFEIPEIIQTVTEDNRRQVWIAGSNEIYYSTLDGAWHHLDKEPIGCNIQEMAIDNNGRIWLATDNGLISYCDGEKVLFNRQHSGLLSNNLRCIAIDRHGHLWMGSNAGVIIFDRQAEVAYHTKMSFKLGLGWTVNAGSAPLWVQYCGITESGNTFIRNGGCLMIMSTQSLFELMVRFL